MGLGVFHGELTSLLWGGAFGFVWAYVAVAGWWASRSQVNAEGSLAVVPEKGLVFQTKAVPRAPALFGWSLEVEGVHSPHRRFALRRPLETEVVFDLPSPRGLYQTKARWALGDAFGFFRWSPGAEWTARVVVAPRPRPFVPPTPPRVGQGTGRPRKTGIRPGDPFDVRPYQPGDDLRRLHWPLYAHSGQPFVRTADPAPPTGQWHLVVDPEARDDEELDHRLGALVTWLKHLESRGQDWTLEIPGDDAVVGPGRPWADALAALRLGVLPPAPARSGSFVLVTGPTSEGGRRWRDSGKAFHTVVVEEPQRPQTPRRPWWAR